MARCRDGDEAAWAEFVDRFSRYVYAIAIRGFALSKHEAEDVFQEVFSRAYDRLDTLRDDDAVKAWLAQMTRRLAIDRIRAAGREVLVEELPESVDDAYYARLDEAMSVRQAMEALPEHCSEILDRFFTRDETYRMIGEKLDIPAGTIASRISRCLGRLKVLLADGSEIEMTGEGR